MSASKLGKRWTCFSCQAKFFDLNKQVPECPKCQANQNEKILSNLKQIRLAKEESIPDENIIDEQVDLMDDDEEMSDLESFEELEERMEKKGLEEEE